MVTVTELNRAPNISANKIDAASVSASDELNIPTYPTRGDVPSTEGLYRVNDVDGSGRTGVILRVS